MKFFKVLFKTVLILILVLVLAVAGLLGWLTVREYMPDPIEALTAEQTAPAQPLQSGSEVTVLSMNIGYCALGADSDFFMDGGKDTRPDSEQVILDNLSGIRDLLAANPTDFVFLQEVDRDSMRSYDVDEVSALAEDSSVSAQFACNFSCDFVPFPLPPIGKVHSGLLTVSSHDISQAERISLPCPFGWPVRIGNLKRCLLVTRTPVEGTDKELVLINLHLEAYDDGEGKLAQTQQLLTLLSEEYEKGNYVIAGGDFNQTFPGMDEQYPNTHTELWAPGRLEVGGIPEGWQYVFDGSTPTCRLLNQPYDPADTEGTQYFVIDGFIVSPNLGVNSVKTVDAGFMYSDHNPVVLSFTLK